MDSSFFVDGSSTYLGGSGRRSEQLEKRLPGIEFSQGRQVEKRGEKKLSPPPLLPPYACGGRRILTWKQGKILFKWSNIAFPKCNTIATTRTTKLSIIEVGRQKRQKGAHFFSPCACAATMQTRVSLSLSLSLFLSPRHRHVFPLAPKPRFSSSVLVSFLNLPFSSECDLAAPRRRRLFSGSWRR